MFLVKEIRWTCGAAGRGAIRGTGMGERVYTDTQNVIHSTTAVVMVTEEPALPPPTTYPNVVKLEPQHLAKPGVSAASLGYDERSRNTGYRFVSEM